MSEDAREQARSARRVTWAFAGFAILWQLLVFDAEAGAPDEQQRWRLAESLVSQGPAALWNSLKLSRYPPLLSLVAAPFVGLGQLLDGAPGGPWAARFGFGVSALASATTCVVFHGAAQRWMSRPRAALAVAVLFTLTSPVLPYSKRFYSESLSALLVMVVFVAAVEAFRAPDVRLGRGAGLALVLLPLNNLLLPGLLVAALVGAALVERRRDLVKEVVVAAALGGVLLLLTLWIRGGGRFDAGYGGERFTFNTLEGLAGLLFGPGRSVFLFAPALGLALVGTRDFLRFSRGGALALLAFSLGALVATASWWAWWGGICWGPRLLVPVLPALTLPLLFVAEAGGGSWRLGAIPVLVAGLYVQGLGVSFKHDFDIYFWMRADGRDERRAWFEPGMSALVRMPRHFRDHPWDVSSVFLTREDVGPSVVSVGAVPVRKVKVTHRGDALLAWWSVSELRLVRTDGQTETGPGGGWSVRASRNAGEAALAIDGLSTTRWSTKRKRLDGDWLELDLGRERTDVARLELWHQPRAADFPNALEARAKADDGTETSLVATAATPRLAWRRSIWLAALGMLAFLGLAGRRSRAGA